MQTKRFARYAWVVLGYNLLVILWGAFVRATGSGAGCGSHWPLCNGEIVPRAARLETLIEFSHRLTSGVALLLVLGLLIGAFRLYPKGHLLRRASVVSTFFLFTEALLGAGLVLFEYVAADTSVARAYWMAGHLINTFLLLASLTLTAWWASGGSPLRWRGQGPVGWVLGLALVGMLLLGANGGITALGDTLVLQAGVTPAESPLVAQLVALRLYHPALAFVVGALLLLAAWVVRNQRPSAGVIRYSNWLGGLYVGQFVLGGLNVALKAPVWIQLLHLLLADSIWIVLILLAAVALAQPDPVRKSPSPYNLAYDPKS